MAEKATSAALPGGVRAMAEADLALVLSWRNHPEVRRFMFHQGGIGLEEHRAWFERLSADASSHLLVYLDAAGVPAGFARLTRVDAGPVADWGFYAAPGAPRGTGLGLGRAVLAHAFGPLRLHKVCGQVAAFNEASLRMHRKLGFHEEGVLREQHFDGSRFQDVHCFGMLAGELATESPA